MFAIARRAQGVFARICGGTYCPWCTISVLFVRNEAACSPSSAHLCGVVVVEDGLEEVHQDGLVVMHPIGAQRAVRGVAPSDGGLIKAVAKGEAAAAAGAVWSVERLSQEW